MIDNLSQPTLYTWQVMIANTSFRIRSLMKEQLKKYLQSWETKFESLFMLHQYKFTT